MLACSEVLPDQNITARSEENHCDSTDSLTDLCLTSKPAFAVNCDTVPYMCSLARNNKQKRLRTGDICPDMNAGITVSVHLKRV